MKNLIGASISMVFILACMACTQVDPDPGITYFDLEVDMWIHDKDGHNLLDSTSSGYYKKEDIRVSYLQNGIKKEFHQPNLEANRSFVILKNEGNAEHFMRFFVYEGSKDNEMVTAFIRWRDKDEDTLQCTLSRVPPNILSIKKVSFNRILKYDVATSKDITWGNGIFQRFLEIQK